MIIGSRIFFFFSVIIPFTLFSSDNKPHFFEQYKPGLYVKIQEERKDDSLYINPNTEFNHLPSDVTTIILKDLPVSALLTLRHVDTYLAGHITFYQGSFNLNELKDISCRTPSHTDRYKNLLNFFFGSQKQSSVEDKRIHYIDMIKRGALTINSFHSLHPDTYEQDSVGALIESKAPTIKVYGPLLSKKGKVTWFAEKLPFNEYIKHIVFDIGEMSEQDEKALGIIIQKCSNLKDFWIRHSFEHYENGDKKKRGQIFDRGAKAIAKGVASHKNIEWLEIIHTNIGNIGAFALAAGLSRNESLRILNLGGNRIGRDGMEALILVGEKHKNLHNLEMNFNLPPDSNKEVSAYRTFKRDGGYNFVSWEQ